MINDFKMVSSDNESVCNSGSSTEGEVEVRLQLSVLSLAIKNGSAPMIITNLRVSWPPSLLLG